jgi:hypothetical protein
VGAFAGALAGSAAATAAALSRIAAPTKAKRTCMAGFLIINRRE